MSFDKNFKPCLRFIAVSDIHYKDERTAENDRFENAIKYANELSKNDERYNKLDALYIVGDFADNGSEYQMNAIKKAIDENLLPETQYALMLASHEFSEKNGGEKGALERFDRIFNLPVDDHRVINGFHFISVTCTKGCHFDEAKQKWVAEELAKAAKDDPFKPIFFFQHPHITDTVSGSIYWGEDELIPALMNYPQVINFSGHSHAPINDPRSIHQHDFTCLGTGTLSYFELDEFDKYYGTLPPHKEEAAQMLIVEADEQGRVRIYPYDVLTGQFFKQTWEIDTPWDPSSFVYTDNRYRTENAPYFPEDAFVKAEVEGNKANVVFSQAADDIDFYANDYYITLYREDSSIARRASVWSEYYFSNMPETLSVPFEGLEKGKYTAVVSARSFWSIYSTNTLKISFEIDN